MRKVSLLLGTLGGAVAGYLFSNSKLREELADAKDAEAAGKILAKHLQHDGKKIGSEVQKFAKSQEVQKNLGKAKKFVADHAKKLQKEMNTFVKESTAKATKAAKSSTAKATKSVKKVGGFKSKNV